MKKIFLGIVVFLGIFLTFYQMDLSAAKSKSKKNKISAIQTGTKVREKVEAKGIFSKECYDAYYGCMDQFCITDNLNGGSCSCSNKSKEYEKQLSEIKELLLEANRIKTVEVEKIEAGAKADIIFGDGIRKYTETGELMTLAKQEKVKKSKEQEQKDKQFAELFGEDNDEDEDEEDFDSLEGKFGDELRKEAERICKTNLPESCSKDISILRQIYSRQITADCKAFENEIAKQKMNADTALADAEKSVREAVKEKLDEVNKFDRGTCMVNFKKCMMTDDACGSDWRHCVSTIANENMQNNDASNSFAGSKVDTVDIFDITKSTMEILESKRYICSKVLDQCMNERDNVWPDFLREIAPTLKTAELNIEMNLRQSCLGDVSSCIQKSCKDDIVGKGVDTMDSCLSRPEMVRSFCKPIIERCERMEPLIWGYVVDKLTALRVDACTSEIETCVKERCGEDYLNCAGLDLKNIKDICPIDKLVVCKKNNKDFKIDDVEQMVRGLFLNIDNSMLSNCQKKVDDKMAELCGSTVNCNAFASDDTIGTGSLRSQKKGTLHRITGLISFGSIKVGHGLYNVVDGKTFGSEDDEEGVDNILSNGEIGIKEYLNQVRLKNLNTKDKEEREGIIAQIEAELNNIAGTINRTISILEQDPQISFCIHGRDLTQITGKDGDITKARFPNLLNQVKYQISMSALRKAQNNYNKKLNEEIAKATKNADLEVAQYMCNMMSKYGTNISSNAEEPLLTPYSLVYEVGVGMKTSDLADNSGTVVNQESKTMGGEDSTYYYGETGGVNMKSTSMFSRETRICKICKTGSVQNCKTEGNVWFGMINMTDTECKNEVIPESCHEIEM